MVSPNCTGEHVWEMSSACCIIGAGYSFVGGLPLTKDLFNSGVAVVSKQATLRYQTIWQDYDQWRGKNPSRNPEEYLADLYEGRGSESGFLFSDSLFPLAVELVAAVLATPRGYDVRPVNPRYGVRITLPSWCYEHEVFWRCVTEVFQDVMVVTTNYDLLIERSLRHKPMKRKFGTGCYYGGLKRPQVLRGTAMPFSVTKPQELVELRGSIPIYKLHGSLNWALSSGGLELYQDMRPAFRHGGDAAIVPPIPEKAVPEWLVPIWEEAERKLSQTDCWIVCGYSLPDYDTAIRGMLKRASEPNPRKVFILDPNSAALHSVYKQNMQRVEIYCLEGLPEGVQQLYDLAANGLTGS